MSDPNSERIGKTVRKHVRISVGLDAEFVLEGDESGEVYRSVSRDIGRGGICLIVMEGRESLLRKTASVMPRLKVSIFMREREAISVTTRTAWISGRVGWFLRPADEDMPVLLGMAFEDLTDQDGERIDTLIEECILKDRLPVEEIESRIVMRVNPSPGPDDGRRRP